MLDRLSPVVYSNQRILTTAQVAEAYETDEKIIRKNFERNPDRYTLGKHFFVLEGEELKKFKEATRQFDVTLKFASILYLWTKKGAFLHAKSLNTDKAWELYEQLIDFYFEQLGSLATHQEINIMQVVNGDAELLRSTIENLEDRALSMRKDIHMLKSIEGHRFPSQLRTRGGRRLPRVRIVMSEGIEIKQMILFSEEE